ncbi:sacsin N-terminal ATP-binding-like domain-containing protein [Actinoplanes siamensis]|uniref:sacsin N-terminal ATP-binding-like domain-containing protein n=1 Tax=Actinoplanes siamensis TaxID=1223317 RepID=UPI0036202F60
MDWATRLSRREIAAIESQRDNEELRENLLKNLDERGAAQEMVRQQYSGRYPFELLQNANDAAAEAGVRGRAFFLLTEDALIVADDGSGFGDQQVKGICSLGRSPKHPGAAVGHKGLGFKSVGEITDRPQIISENTAFQFDSDRLRREVIALLGPLPAGQRLPAYAFPFPVTDEDLGADAEVVGRLRVDGFRTVIRLPLRDGVDRHAVAERLTANLRPRLLLFLPGVEKLELRGTDADFVASVRPSGADTDHVVLETEDKTERWLLYRGEQEPDPDTLVPLGDAWSDLKKVRWAVAVPLGETGLPRADETFPLHVYFPTEESPGLHVLVHAEWVLTMDRKQLAASPEAQPYNDHLQNLVANFLADRVVTDLVRRSKADAAAVAVIVPASAAPAGEAATRLRVLWTAALARARFLPVLDGTLARPAEVCLLPNRLPDLRAAHRLAAFDRTRTLRPDIEQAAATRAFLSNGATVEIMPFAELLGRLRPPTQETVADYYRFLLSCWQKLPDQLAVLRKTARVLTTGGQTLIPAEQPVFLPRKRDDTSIPDDIPVPIADIPAIERAEALLRELGVRPFEWRDLIRDYLIKILTDAAADPGERERAMAGLSAYHQTRLGGSGDLAAVLGRVLLPVRSADGTCRGLRAGATAYFGSDWTGSADLEILYGPFGKAEFLDIPVPDDPDQRRTDLDFYRMLGVCDHPRIDEATPSDWYGYLLGGLHRHPHAGIVFHQWRAAPPASQAAQCPQGHPQTQQLRVSYRLDRHQELVASGDPQRMLALWRQLARRWATVYEPATKAVFRCVNKLHSGERDRPAESLFAYLLRTRTWVPVVRGTEAALVRPRDAWVEATGTPRHVRDRIPHITETMYQMTGGSTLVAALKLTDTGRPRVADLLGLLASIAAEADGLGHTTRDIELAARYIQRLLQNVLTEDQTPHPDPGSVRLLASHNGAGVFVAQPPYAEDPLLRDTWEVQRPVLSAEARLPRLARYLRLTKLDDVVTASAEAFGPHPPHDPVHIAVRRRLDEVKPYLIALVRAENPPNEPAARSALQRLELVVCDSLVLRYRHEDVDFDREDAVCFIATRTSRYGSRTATAGTAYLQLEPGLQQPYWFAFGRQLAQHLGVPGLAEAVTMLLTARPEDRGRMMGARQITPAEINEIRTQFGLTEEEETDNPVDALLTKLPVKPRPAPVPAAPPSPASSSPAANPPAATPTPVVTAPIAPPVPAPPVDHGSVRIINDALQTFVAPGAGSGHTWTGGGQSTAPPLSTEAEKRRIGRRGEEAAFHAERERLRTLGKDPDLAVWVSEKDELAPYDIRSVDADDQVIRIEVKSTRSTDPREPFYLSSAELVEAGANGERYVIYRVTEAAGTVPQIRRVADPMRMIKEGKGRLLLDRAQMVLAFSGDEGGGGQT